MPTTRIAIWLAVSTEAQAADDKDSLPAQLRDATEWAEANEYPVVATFEVPGHTRSYIRFSDAATEIPAYKQLETACQARGFDVLWCRERSRLGRTRALIATAEAIVAEAGAEVFSAKMPHRIGAASASSRGLLGAIEGWQAEDEITQLVYRHKMGMAGRLRRGLPGGSWPMGYEAVKNDAGKTTGGRFTEYADAVRYVTQLFLQGFGYATIARMMNKSPYKSPGGGQWHSGVIHKAMHNDTYGGIVSYGGQRHESDRYPHLWDAETFEAVKRERQRRSQKTGGKPYRSAVSGVAICGRCGGRLVVNTVRGHRYFRCPTHARKFVTGGGCHPNHIPEHRIIAKLDEHLAEVRAAKRDEMLALLDSGKTNRADIEAERQKATEHIESIRIQQDRLADYAAAGALSLDAVGRKNEELAEQLSAWRVRIYALEDELARVPSPEERAAALSGLLDRAVSIGDLSPGAVRLALQRAGVRVVVEDGKIIRVE